jgi:DNA-binding MarR family transcriptional regulator
LTTGFLYWKLVANMSHRPPPPSRIAPELADLTELTLTVFRLNGALLQWGDRLVGPLGLTSARWQMLGALALADAPLTAPQVGEAMGVTRQGAQKQLHALIALGLVEARPNPAHRRSPLHALTTRGKALYARAEALWTTRAAGLAASIPKARARAAADTLAALLALLQPPSPDPTP